MSTAVLEEIIEKLELLSEAEQQKLAEAIEQQKQIKAEAERRAFIRSLRGKYKDVMPSPELRAKWKAEEIELEDKNWKSK
ncbi:MAG: hypothetical protein M3Q33_12325 [Acidobacteriota bacterium]|nr:hypothetical protein [Acidobacteriota bacterium]